MLRKKRILFIGEATYTHSGFGVYGNEILKRLVKTNKYDIAEFASYGLINDPRDINTTWPIYANAVKDDDPRINEYRAKITNQFGEWRFDRVCLDFKPDIVCTPPGELVLTIDGYKPIEKIKVGDIVPTHTGKLRKVTKCFKNQYKNDLLHIYWNGCNTPLKLTLNHPVLIYRHKKQTNQKKSNKDIYTNVTAEFVSAGDIKEKDLIVLSPPEITGDFTILDITHFLSNYIVENNKIYPTHKTNTNAINQTIRFNNELGRLLGYIIADGCIQPSGISITFHYNELNFVKDAINLFDKIFGIHGNYHKDKDKNSWTININSTILSEFFTNFCNQYKIPQFILSYSQDCLEGIICGLVRGDGCYKTNTVSFTSITKEIAYIYRIICTMLHIPTNLQKNIGFDVEGYGSSGLLLHNIVNKHKKYNYKEAEKAGRVTQIINGHLVSSVRRIRKIPYNGTVYNIEVEIDNSYILNQASVHNCDIRDPWMLQWELDSPFRRFFHIAWMPTCDSKPQQENWIDSFLQVDGVFAYSDWNLEVLRSQSNNKLKLKCAAPPGTDLSIFKPTNNKAKHRTNMGLSPDINIIGTIMRNQRRKLYPDLFEAFKLFLERCDPEIAKKTFLYIHTSYPDAGWNIPMLLREYEISHKVIFSYVCRTCNQWFASPFQDAVGVCPHCGNSSAVMPNVSFGVPPEKLADILKTFDVYVQYSITEGFGMPQVEAAACGVPVMAVNYSAMEDIVKKTGGIPLKVGKMFLELETQAYRAMPDNEYCANEFIKFFNLPFYSRQKLGFQARLACEKYYNWDNTAKIWEAYLDSVQLINEQGKWDSSPLNIYDIPSSIPENLSNNQFVDWLYYAILRRPDLRYTYQGLKLCSELNTGMTLEGGMRPIDRNIIFNYYKQRAENYIIAEKVRCGLLPLRFDDFISYKHIKEQSLNIKDGDIIT